MKVNYIVVLHSANFNKLQMENNRPHEEKTKTSQLCLPSSVNKVLALIILLIFSRKQEVGSDKARFLVGCTIVPANSSLRAAADGWFIERLITTPAPHLCLVYKPLTFNYFIRSYDKPTSTPTSPYTHLVANSKCSLMWMHYWKEHKMDTCKREL